MTSAIQPNKAVLVVGAGDATGGAIARRGRQVVAAIGDGSALYAAEALWTGAHPRTVTRPGADA